TELKPGGEGRVTEAPRRPGAVGRNDSGQGLLGVEKLRLGFGERPGQRRDAVTGAPHAQPPGPRARTRWPRTWSAARAARGRPPPARPRDQRLELSLCSFVLDISLSGRPVDGRKLCPRVGPRHIDDAHRRDLGPWRLGPKQARLISALNAAPELLLGCDQQVLIQG